MLLNDYNLGLKYALLYKLKKIPAQIRPDRRGTLAGTRKQTYNLDKICSR